MGLPSSRIAGGVISREIYIKTLRHLFGIHKCRINALFYSNSELRLSPYIVVLIYNV